MEYIVVLLVLPTIAFIMLCERHKSKLFIKKTKEETEKQLSIMSEVEEVKPLPVFHQYHDLSEIPHKTYYRCSACESYNVTAYKPFAYSFQDINNPLLYCHDCGTKGTNRKYDQAKTE